MCKWFVCIIQFFHQWRCKSIMEMINRVFGMREISQMGSWRMNFSAFAFHRLRVSSFIIIYFFFLSYNLKIFQFVIILLLSSSKWFDYLHFWFQVSKLYVLDLDFCKVFLSWIYLCCLLFFVVSDCEVPFQPTWFDFLFPIFLLVCVSLPPTLF